MGIRRFDQFQADLGVSRHRLSDRLSKLVAEGVFGDFEVVFDDNEGILEGFFQDFHLFLDVY